MEKDKRLEDLENKIKEMEAISIFLDVSPIISNNGNRNYY